MKTVGFLFLALFIKSCVSECYEGNQDYPVFDPDIFRNASEMIAANGYPAEEHEVITEDGYILSLQRIPHGRQNRTSGNPPVLLHHGLYGISINFLLNLPNQSLGYILADAGYDVWLANARGNTYSRKHVSLSPRKPPFWKYSLDELALTDLPAIIDYILNTTGEEKLFYTGHSMGGTIICALLAGKPQYNKKIRVAVGMAAVVYTAHQGVFDTSGFITREACALDHLGTGEIMAKDFVSTMLTEVLCNVDMELCEQIYSKKHNLKFYNVSRLPVALATEPAGAAMRMVIHYAQVKQANKLQMYDFGPEGNMKKYNQTTPPEYNLDAISAPMALMWGLNDPLADPVDVNLLAQKLKNVVLNYPVPDPEWGHTEFVGAIDAYQLVYKEIIKLFSQY